MTQILSTIKEIYNDILNEIDGELLSTLFQISYIIYFTSLV